MNDKNFILTKIFKKHTIALLLMLVLMVLFFLNVFNKPVVYASEQIARVQCDVVLVNGEGKELISSDIHGVSNLDSSVIDFSNIDIELQRKSKLEINYEIMNIYSSNCNFALNLKENMIENIIVEYYANDNYCGELTKAEFVVQTKEIINIKVVVFVDQPSCDAILNGSLELTFECVGETNE